jgi:hypothetical protein
MTNYPPQKNVQALARYRCEDGHLFEVIRTRALRGYNPVLECPEPSRRPLYVGDVCGQPSKRVGEGGFWPIRIKDRIQVRDANKARGLKPYRIYRRVGGRLKGTGGL